MNKETTLSLRYGCLERDTEAAMILYGEFQELLNPNLKPKYYGNRQADLIKWFETYGSMAARRICAHKFILYIFLYVYDKLQMKDNWLSFKPCEYTPKLVYDVSYAHMILLGVIDWTTSTDSTAVIYAGDPTADIEEIVDYLVAEFTKLVS